MIWEFINECCLRDGVTLPTPWFAIGTLSPLPYTSRATIPVHLQCGWRFMLLPPTVRMVNSSNNEGWKSGFAGDRGNSCMIEGGKLAWRRWGSVMRLIDWWGYRYVIWLIEWWGCVSAAMAAWSGWFWVVRLHVHGSGTTCVPVSLCPRCGLNLVPYVSQIFVKGWHN